jgi:putative DNA primase/helicase
MILDEKFRYDPRPIIGTRRMSDVQPEPVTWLWSPRIAQGKVTLIAGDPGLGKSMLTVAMAAHVSRGAPWPVDRAPCPQGDVVMVSAEDDPGDTIRPRLDAAGADVSRVHYLTVVHELDPKGNPRDRSFNLARDVTGLDDLLRQTPDCRLVSIDPVSAYLGGADSHNNADIRALLAPLATVASKYKVAIVCVTHLNKSQQANALYRASGSLAFVAAARAAYSVTKDPDDHDRRLILPLKNNLGDDRTGFAYRIIEAENGAPVLVWEDEPVEISLEDIANAVTDRKPRPAEQAKTMLLRILAGGEALQKDIEAQAEALDISWRTVMRAKKDLGITSSKHRFDGQWIWKLPPISQDLRYLREAATDEECQTPPYNKVASFDESGTLRDTKDAKHYEECQKTGRGVLASFDETGCDADMPGRLISAAIAACKGTSLDPRRFLNELDSDGRAEILADPETARIVAKSVAARLVP